MRQLVRTAHMPTLRSNPSAAPLATPAGPLVLVVEDDEDTRFLYAESLGHLGYRTAGEGDARSGIDAALRLRPDAIMMDLAMPGMTGIEAIRVLKADPRTRQSLIVVVTGSGMKWFEEARAAGCDAFFAKPFDPSALAHVLRARAPSPEPSATQLPPHVVKRCSCGREFTRSTWAALPRCGRMHLARRDATVELRNCPCGSSMALQFEGPDDAADAEVPSGYPIALGKILVVERDVNVRRLVLHFSIGCAYLVEFLDDGFAAPDRVRRSPPAALVAEVMIPRLDGLALCQLLKSDSSTAQVPIMLFSVLAAGERARKAGADVFLGKPLEKASFVASMLTLTDPGNQTGAPARRKRVVL